ncbi:unnamed protein product [Leptidea sinapis]|uniref:Uncharacterized protein n=1 Tax=Leptidea sinapis TaxID=189913 RepID=A0A5E4QBD6_9NEOP|nr:unnamed protein product [Leptidea sinapis]
MKDKCAYVQTGLIHSLATQEVEYEPLLATAQQYPCYGVCSGVYQLRNEPPRVAYGQPIKAGSNVGFRSVQEKKPPRRSGLFESLLRIPGAVADNVISGEVKI